MFPVELQLRVILDMQVPSPHWRSASRSEVGEVGTAGRGGTSHRYSTGCAFQPQLETALVLAIMAQRTGVLLVTPQPDGSAHHDGPPTSSRSCKTCWQCSSAFLSILGFAFSKPGRTPPDSLVHPSSQRAFLRFQGACAPTMRRRA